MNNTDAPKTSSASVLKAIIGSLIGILVFFVPFPAGGGESKIPLVILIDTIKESLGGALQYITLAAVVLLCITWVVSRFTSNKKINIYHKKDGNIIGVLFILAAIFSILLTFNIGPAWLLHEDVGGLSIALGGSVLLTLSVAGFLVVFLMSFGFAEFIGTLMEPLMRRIYKVPGRAAVDAVTSFVASPAVGVFVTNKFYKEKYYTQKEAAAITTNFSVVSIGFFALIASIGGILDYLPQMIITSFLLTFVIAFITIRIPPISRKKDEYIDGQKRTKDNETHNDHILSRACKAAYERAAMSGPEVFKKAFFDALSFAQKIVAYIIAIATLSLIVATYTPIFEYVGAIFQYPLELLGLPSAADIAPAILVSLAEVALPAIIVSSTEAPTMSVFFICTLSTLQIIFFTESANAMLESDIPLSVIDLIVVFLVRTIIAIPLVALAAHLIF